MKATILFPFVGLLGCIKYVTSCIDTDLSQAIATFLSSMGLTSEEALKRRDMVDTILGYHIIPYKKVGAKGLSSRPRNHGIPCMVGHPVRIPTVTAAV
jgi:hypothetical protein